MFLLERQKKAIFNYNQRMICDYKMEKYFKHRISLPRKGLKKFKHFVKMEIFKTIVYLFILS